jgi:FAD/FMN-containing dehydrogenase
MAGVVEDIASEIGADAVSIDPGDLETYGRDWTRVHAPRPLALVRPRTIADVQAVVRRCRAAKQPIVPSGGRTGLAGGAVATKGEIVLSLERMRAMGSVDVIGRTVRVEAGAVTAAVHEHCAPHGLTWPVDFASKGSSHVGGNIATNAGGIHVIRYGLTRQWVLGLEVVLADGELITPGGALEKNNTGLDLRQLFIGTEGTLGIVVAATLKLAPLPGPRDTMLFAVADLAGVLRLFRATASAPFVLHAFEFFTDRSYERVLRHRRLALPFAERAPCYVVLDAERRDEAKTEAWLTGLFEEGLVSDGTMAQHAAQAEAIWSLRESISESLSATGLPHKNDVSLPIVALEAFCADLERLVAERYPGWEVCLFGHIGDGNLHVNVMKPDELPKEAFLARTHEVDHAMFELVRRHGGSISAEHGIGLLKKDYLGYTRSPAEIAVMQAVKRALDPDDLLNPGKVIG